MGAEQRDLTNSLMDKPTFAALKKLLDIMEDDISNRGMMQSYKVVRDWMDEAEKNIT